MEFKKVIFRYKRDIRSIPRKELIKNLENIRENYLKALPEFKKHFRTQAFSDRGIGELDIRSKINYYIKKLSKRKLTKKEAPLFQGFLESQARKVTPKSEKHFKILAKQETKFEFKEYLRMANRLQSKQVALWEQTIKNLDETAEVRELNDYELQVYNQFRDLIRQSPSRQIQKIAEKLNLTEDDIREFLNSNRNVDLSHVVWDSDGLVEFEEDYDISLPVARFLDYFGYDYTEYGKSGQLVPRK